MVPMLHCEAIKEFIDASEEPTFHKVGGELWFAYSEVKIKNNDEEELVFEEDPDEILKSGGVDMSGDSEEQGGGDS